jgi:hypothetical protein
VVIMVIVMVIKCVEVMPNFRLGAALLLVVVLRSNLEVGYI